jgi:muramoyltetrapeptide carboxypeptidase
LSSFIAPPYWLGLGYSNGFGQGKNMRIAVVAPSGRFNPQAAEPARAIAAEHGAELHFHPQCGLSQGHFAGPDAERLAAFVEAANDPAFDAIWFARGGYGACRIAADAVAALGPAARDKAYLGYSDAGYLLAGLYRAGFPNLAHGPLAQDVLRPGGEAAVHRALGWLTRRDPAALDPNLAAGRPHAAFNITVFGLLLGTELEPDLTDHVLLLEDVAEHAYRTDRALFHITGQKRLRALAGIRLGRVSDVPPNDPDFGATAEEIARYWCSRSGIPFLGGADIGHDAENKVVPFGRL